MDGRRVDRAAAKRFGRNLFMARRRAGFSQEELGALCSLHRTEIGYLEHGARLPRLDTALKLATALEVPLDELADGITWRAGEGSRGSFQVRP